MAKMFLTQEETRKLLKLHDEDLAALCAAGRLREFRDGGRYMYKTDQVEALAQELEDDRADLTVDERIALDSKFEGAEDDGDDVECEIVDDDALQSIKAKFNIKPTAPAPTEENVVRPSFGKASVNRIKVGGEYSGKINPKQEVKAEPAELKLSEADAKVFNETVFPGKTGDQIDAQTKAAYLKNTQELFARVQNEIADREILKELKAAADNLNTVISKAFGQGLTVHVSQSKSTGATYGVVSTQLLKEIR